MAAMPEVAYEDALKRLIAWLRNPSPAQYSTYGYEVYLPNLLRDAVSSLTGNYNPAPSSEDMAAISPVFYTAAWELCRRGVLRPGISKYGRQATEDGASGNGYSITPFGRIWLAEADKDDFVPTEPERFAVLLKRYETRFGLGFSARGQEAIRCYDAHAYLACCAMCGAAAESIMLATAIAKAEGDDGQVLKEYASARGRSQIERRVLAHATGHLQRQIEGLAGITSYWRDDAAHGRASRLSDPEAFTALVTLLRLAAVVDDNWTALMGPHS